MVKNPVESTLPVGSSHCLPLLPLLLRLSAPYGDEYWAATGRTWGHQLHLPTLLLVQLLLKVTTQEARRKLTLNNAQTRTKSVVSVRLIYSDSR